MTMAEDKKKRKRLSHSRARNAAIKAVTVPPKRREPTPAAPRTKAQAVQPQPAAEPDQGPMIPYTMRISVTLAMEVETICTNARNGGKEEERYQSPAAFYRAALQWAREQGVVTGEVRHDTRKETKICLPEDLKIWFASKPKGRRPEYFERAVRAYIRTL